MLKLIVSDKPVEVNFTHYDNVSAPWTLCHVVTPEKTYNGSAYCHAGDQYNRNTGRKISLSRALFNAFPYDKRARQIVWNAYFNKRGKVE